MAHTNFCQFHDLVLYEDRYFPKYDISQLSVFTHLNKEVKDNVLALNLNIAGVKFLFLNKHCGLVKHCSCLAFPFVFSTDAQTNV
jgi:hypothetical protein